MSKLSRTGKIVWRASHSRGSRAMRRKVRLSCGSLVTRLSSNRVTRTRAKPVGARSLLSWRRDARRKDRIVFLSMVDRQLNYGRHQIRRFLKQAAPYENVL